MVTRQSSMSAPRSAVTVASPLRPMSGVICVRVTPARWNPSRDLDGGVGHEQLTEVQAAQRAEARQIEAVVAVHAQVALLGVRRDLAGHLEGLLGAMGMPSGSQSRSGDTWPLMTA
jgi:hypothetical protein